MRTQVRILALITCLLLAMGPDMRATDIYVVSDGSVGLQGPTTDFGKIDSVTGTYTSISSITAAGAVANLVWNPNANNFWVTVGMTFMHTLSPTGTLSSSFGSNSAVVYGMAYRSNNQTMYAYDSNGDVTGTINLTNGNWTNLNLSPGPLALNVLGGRYSIMNDTMYYAGAFATSGIGTMGYAANSTYQQIKADPTYTYISLANDGTTMYGIYGDGTAGNQKLYTIDVATGTLTAGPAITGAGLGTYFHGAAIGPVPVPEPSTWALGALATGVMAAVCQRRKSHLG